MGVKYYEIVHYQTDLVWTIVDGEILLDIGERKNEQLFDLTKKDEFYRIKDIEENNIQLDGILQLADVHEKNESQKFKFISYNPFEPLFLKDTVFILSNDREAKSLDLMNAGR